MNNLTQEELRVAFQKVIRKEKTLEEIREQYKCSDTHLEKIMKKLKGVIKNGKH